MKAKVSGGPGFSAEIGGDIGLGSRLDGRKAVSGRTASDANFYSTQVGAGAAYTGPTDVVPSAEPQILGTRGKTVKTDITVWAIPYAETENDKHGFTATIGG